MGVTHFHFMTKEEKEALDGLAKLAENDISFVHDILRQAGRSGSNLSDIVNHVLDQDKIKAFRNFRFKVGSDYSFLMPYNGKLHSIGDQDPQALSAVFEDAARKLEEEGFEPLLAKPRPGFLQKLFGINARPRENRIAKLKQVRAALDASLRRHGFLSPGNG